MEGRKLILVTGGARSGKSSFAENMLLDLDKVLYIATSIPFDEEMKERVNHHRKSRPESWDTLECYKNFKQNLLGRIDNYNGILLDCVTIMITNIILDTCKENTLEEFKYAEELALKEVKELLNIFKEFKGQAILVTNEVGFGVVPESRLGRYFRDIAGRVNQYIAKECRDVYLVVSSIPLKVK